MKARRCINDASGHPRRSIQLVDGAIQTLVVQGTRHRRQLVAKLARRRRHRVRLDRLGVAPDLDHREVIRPADLLDDLEAEIVVIPAAVLAQALEGGDAIVLARGITSTCVAT